MKAANKEFLSFAATRVAMLARCDVPDDEVSKDAYFQGAVHGAASRLTSAAEAKYEGLPRPLSTAEAIKVVRMALKLGRVSK